jgi:transposase
MARVPRGGTHADCEPDKVHAGPAGHSQLQTDPAQGAERLATVHTPEGMPLPPNTLAELQRDMARLGCVVSQIREIEQARQKRLEQQPETGPHAMVRLLARIVGVGVETADLLVHEVLSRPMRDRRAVARYAGLRNLSKSQLQLSYNVWRGGLLHWVGG